MVGAPTSASLTVMVSVHGLLAEGVGGQLTLPVSACTSDWLVFCCSAGSGYAMTCGKQAETEQRTMLSGLHAQNNWPLGGVVGVCWISAKKMVLPTCPRVTYCCTAPPPVWTAVAVGLDGS